MNAISRQLILAAHSGDVRKAELLLKQVVNPNEQDEQQRTALHWAALQGHITVVRLLLQNGANTSIVAKDGRTALMLAEQKSHAGIAHILRNTKSSGQAEQLAAYSAENSKSKETMNKHIIEAAASNSTSRIDLLVKGGADPNATDEKGCSALMCAAQNGNLAAVRTLLTHKADIELKDK